MIYDSPPEPTEEDCCGMRDHDFGDYVDPETGWRVCMCGLFTEPVEGEPHDEYSALRADLIDEYVEVLASALRAVRYDSSFISIRTSRMRISLGTLLRYNSLQYIRLLLESARNTSSIGVEYVTHPLASNMDLAAALGVHLGATQRSVLEKTLRGLGWKGARDNEFNRPVVMGMEMLSEDNIKLARLTASLLDQLNVHKLGRTNDRYRSEDGIAAVSTLLERRPDLIPVIAALFNSRGITEDSAAHAVELLSSDDTVTAALVDGLL